MSEYIFRGKPIDGAHAFVLLGSIKRVLMEAPNPTKEEIESLEKIVEDFGNKLEEDLKKAYPYPWEE